MLDIDDRAQNFHIFTAFCSLPLPLPIHTLLQYCLTDKPEVRSLDPYTTAVQKYPITEMQPVYFLANSFKDAKHKLM